MIKFDSKTNTWIASHHKRHLITKVPYSLKRKNLKSEAQAKRVEKELVILVEKRLHEKVVPNWNTVMEEYGIAALAQGLTSKTVDDMMICLKAHTSQWNDRSIDKISTDEIRLVIKDKLGDRSLHTQKNVLKFIRNVFKYAVEKNILVRNPTPEMKFRLGDKIKGVLNEPQARAFLSKAKEVESEWYPIWATAIYTGMRNGELFALEWSNVDLENRTIKVSQSWNRKDGFKGTKSGNDRMVEIALPLLTMLKELKLQADSKFVLPRLDRWKAGYQAHDLKMFLLGMGLQPIRFHDLRASWATILLSKNIEPIKVMKAGGWVDMKTMMIYIRKAGIDIKGMTDCLDLHDPSQKRAPVFQLKRENS